MGRFPLVHPLGAALINHPFGITHKTILVLCPHRFKQLDTGNSSRTSAVQNNFDIFDLLLADMQGIDQACRTNHRSSMLVIMKNRDIHFLFQALFNDKTFRRLDIFKIDTAKTGAH